jgi:hypothetical protein
MSWVRGKIKYPLYGGRLDGYVYTEITSHFSKGLNNHKEASDLTEAVKQTFYEEYLGA